MSAYTNIPKPTDATYVNVNAQGREQYDQASLTYDDANTFYDGIDYNAYTNLSKPLTGDGLWSSATFPWELSLPWQIGVPEYTRITKPTT